MNVSPRRTGLGEFRPGIASANAAGIRASSSAYPAGDAGTQASLDMVSEKIRDGAVDPDVMGWARTVLKNKGLDGRLHPSVQAQTQALLEELRASTIYAPDAYGREVIQSAAATLCLRPGLCIRGGDCDDLVVALGSATLSLGIPTRVVKQTFYGAAQEHVLIQVQAENGIWLSADPSVATLPVGRSHAADREEYIDPMEGRAELVSIGRPDETRDVMGAVFDTYDARMLGAFSRREVGLAPSHPAWTHPGRSPFPNMRYGRGRWWGWSSRSSRWVVVTPTTCASWSAPVVPIAPVLADAQGQLAASGGQPVTRQWDARTLFLYTQEGPNVVVRVCTGSAPLGTSGLGAFPFPQTIIDQLNKAKVTWDALAADANKCHTPPGSTPGVCPPGYVMQQGGGACELIATADDGTQGATTTTTTSVPAADAPLDDETFASFYQAYLQFLTFYNANSDYTTVLWTNGYIGYRDLLDATYDWQQQAYAWQLKLKPICSLSEPVVDPTPAQTPTSLLAPLFSAQDVTTTSKALVTGAIVAAVGVGLWFSWPLISEARAGIKARTAKAARP